MMKRLADSLIDEQLEPVEQINGFNNVGTLKSNGVEVGIQSRRGNGVRMRFSGTVQRTTSDGAASTNSPRFLLKGGFSTSPWAPWHTGMEGVLEAGRRTRDGDHTDSSLLVQDGRTFTLKLTYSR
jgi:hypothetical protein